MTKRFFFYRCLPLTLCLLIGFVSTRAQSADTDPLTNAAVVKLVKAGFKEKSLLTIIASRPARFDLTTDRLIELKRSGVSEKVILAMIARQEGNEFSDEGWDDEAFMNSNTPLNSNKPTNPGDGSAEIFGSSGGSRGSHKTNNGNGSSSGETVTTGSATVRILRPPSEAGGGPAKLEKTKSLTNDSIVELVEAGFSEGTIIRRIEQSPVDFDLAAPKIEELRKRRVSDKILAAMKTAMGDDSSK